MHVQDTTQSHPAIALFKTQPGAIGFHRSIATLRELGGDAAYPPPGGEYPRGTRVGAFYIGGDTPHVWTVAEINHMATGVDYLLPIWVRSNPAGHSGEAEGRAAADRLRTLGAPDNCAVVLDLEVAIDRQFVVDFKANVGKHTVICYGSSSSLFSNPGPWYWVAEPGTSAPDKRAVGTQFVFDGTYDLSWWHSDFVSAHMWSVRTPKPSFAIHAGDGKTSLLAHAVARKVTVLDLITLALDHLADDKRADFVQYIAGAPIPTSVDWVSE